MRLSVEQTSVAPEHGSDSLEPFRITLPSMIGMGALAARRYTGAYAT
jgi:hypothetical protein